MSNWVIQNALEIANQRSNAENSGVAKHELVWRGKHVLCARYERVRHDSLRGLGRRVEVGRGKPAEVA